MWGNTSHMDEMVKTLRQWHPAAVVHNSPVNSLFYTFHGLDVCGHRLCDDILQLLESLKQSQQECTEISFIGYSAGGLINR